MSSWTCVLSMLWMIQMTKQVGFWMSAWCCGLDFLLIKENLKKDFQSLLHFIMSQLSVPCFGFIMQGVDINHLKCVIICWHSNVFEKDNNACICCVPASMDRNTRAPSSIRWTVGWSQQLPWAGPPDLMKPGLLLVQNTIQTRTVRLG